MGGDVAFLTQDGKLTDIGSWYLGGSETGNIPSGARHASAIFTSSSLLVAVAALWSVV